MYPIIQSEIAKEDKIRLLSKLYIDPDTNCWIWQGTIGPDGYGRFWAKKKCYGPVRYSWAIFVGDVEPKARIRSRCGNKLCCNPEHLEDLSNPTLPEQFKSAVL